MVSEIFPLRTRGRGISLAVLTNFGSNAIVTFAFPPLKVFIHFSIKDGFNMVHDTSIWLAGSILQELLGAENIFLLFAAIAFLAVLFIVRTVPETKGLSLEEIESKILNWKLKLTVYRRLQ